MRYRLITTPQPPPEADIEFPQIMEAAAFVESGEEHLAMLGDMARYGMELLQAQRDYAKARLAAVTAAGSALNPGEDPTAAYSKIAQTVRRTIALRLKLKEDVEKRRAGLVADRAARRAKRAEDHAEAVKDQIDMALSEAHHADLILPDDDPFADMEFGKPEPHEIERREMLDDAELLLEDLDEYGDWLNAPIGETVAKLCVALGLAPDACVKRGDSWWVRRRDTTYEIIREQRGCPVPPLHEVPTAKPSGCGTLDEAHHYRSP